MAQQACLWLLGGAVMNHTAGTAGAEGAARRARCSSEVNGRGYRVVSPQHLAALAPGFAWLGGPLMVESLVLARSGKST